MSMEMGFWIFTLRPILVAVSYTSMKVILSSDDRRGQVAGTRAWSTGVAMADVNGVVFWIFMCAIPGTSKGIINKRTFINNGMGLLLK